MGFCTSKWDFGVVWVVGSPQIVMSGFWGRRGVKCSKWPEISQKWAKTAKNSLKMDKNGQIWAKIWKISDFGLILGVFAAKNGEKM